MLFGAKLGWTRIGAVCALALWLAPVSVPAQPGTTERVSASTQGDQADGASYGATISADGRYVAFSSRADNLVPGDTNGCYDIFVRDLIGGTTEIVSVASGGTQGNGNSAGFPSISADGRFVAFYSVASNLVPGDTNHCGDVFVRDRLLGATAIVSVSSGGTLGNSTSTDPAISADGRYIAFDSLASNLIAFGDTNSVWDVYVRDTITFQTTLVSSTLAGGAGNGASWQPSISAEGQHVAFVSSASNLITGDTNNVADIFVRDLTAGTTQRVSVSTTGGDPNNASESPSISADARYVVFSSGASNLVPGDKNNYEDVFVRDLIAGTTELESVTPGGAFGNNFSGYDGATSISSDGRFVCFGTEATNLDGGPTGPTGQIVVRDRATGALETDSVSSTGEMGNDSSWSSVISGDGQSVVFASAATNLVDLDTNAVGDTFVHHRVSGFRTMSGLVSLQGLRPGAPLPPFLSMSIQLNGIRIGSWEVQLNSDGTYARALPSGHLTLSFKVSHWLRRTITVDTTTGDVQAPRVFLLNGDVNGDNRVGFPDLAWVLLYFGRSNPMADLNGDGVVDIADISLVLMNFGLAGDP